MFVVCLNSSYDRREQEDRYRIQQLTNADSINTNVASTPYTPLFVEDKLYRVSRGVFHPVVIGKPLAKKSVGLLSNMYLRINVGQKNDIPCKPL